MHAQAVLTDPRGCQAHAERGARPRYIRLDCGLHSRHLEVSTELALQCLVILSIYLMTSYKIWCTVFEFCYLRNLLSTLRRCCRR